MDFRILPGPVLIAGALAAEAAAETRFDAEAAISSMVIDRGEQLGGPSVELGLGVETALGGGVLYGAIYRLTPVGADQAAFADEVDYTLGYAWDGTGYGADVSANWLTYPGEGDDASLELAGEIVLDAPLNPAILGFYDEKFEDYGVEILAGPEWGAGHWSHYVIARAGIVEPGDGSASRAYAGLQAGTARPIGRASEFGAFARFDISDQDSFAGHIHRGSIVETRNSGFAVGAVVATAF